MKPYHDFAPWYDRFMDFADYESDAEYLYNLFKQVLPQDARILDMGAGSGSQILPLLRKGLQVEGIDNAAPMLEVLKQKLAAENLSTALYCDDMCSFSSPTLYDAIYSWGDTVHHLLDMSAVEQFFQTSYRLLKSKGFLTFTWRNPDYFYDLEDNGSFYERHEEDYLLWDTSIVDSSRAAIHYTAFLKQEPNLYRRLEETHDVLVLEESELLLLAAKAGFHADYGKNERFFGTYRDQEPFREILLLEKR